jgi:hypothetical protein
MDLTTEEISWNTEIWKAENCTPGSMRGALGNQRPYLAKAANLK